MAIAGRTFSRFRFNKAVYFLIAAHPSHVAVDSAQLSWHKLTAAVNLKRITYSLTRVQTEVAVSTRTAVAEGPRDALCVS